MAFTGNENHNIGLDDATRFTAAYREAEGEIFLGGFFGKEAIKSILDQDNCVGLRIYNAINDNDNRTFVVVGVSADSKDIASGRLAEFAIGCPPNCDPESPLGVVS